MVTGIGPALPPAADVMRQLRGDETVDITLVNLILATIVFALGLWAYSRRHSRAALFVGVAFGLFAVAHLLTALGLAATLNMLLVVIRTLGYISAMAGVYELGR